MKSLGYIIIFYAFSAHAEIKNIIDNSHGLPGDSMKSGDAEKSLRDFFSKLV